MGPPSGPAWTEFRRRLFADWAARGPVRCFACGCPIAAGQGEIEHRISASRRPDLAWTKWWQGEPFLVPVHGSGKRRCPSHDLACNAVIGANAARRDDLGRSVPLTAAEIAAAQERTRARGRSATGRDRRKPPAAAPEPAATGAKPRVFPAAGRAWLTGAFPEPPGRHGPQFSGHPDRTDIFAFAQVVASRVGRERSRGALSAIGP